MLHGLEPCGRVAGPLVVSAAHSAASSGRGTRKMSSIAFRCVASTRSASLPSTRPSRSMATRNAFDPSVTFSMTPAPMPTSAA